MKKLSLLFFALIPFVFFGCGKTDKYVKSVLFYEDGSLWTENSKGEMEWFTSLACGTVLDAFPAVQGSTSQITESKVSARIGKKEEVDFTKVKFNDGIYWIQSALIIPNAEPKLTTGGEIFIYRSPDIVDISNDKVGEDSIVALIEIIEEKEFGSSFAKISYKSSNKVFRDVYIKAENISAGEDDLVAKRIFDKYSKVKNQSVKIELWENLRALSKSSYVNSKVKSVGDELFPPEPVAQENANTYIEENNTLPEQVSTAESNDSNAEYDDYFEFN